MEGNYLNMLFMTGKDNDTFSYSSFFVRLTDKTVPATVSFSDFLPADNLFTLSFNGQSVTDIVSAFYIP